MHFGYLMTRRWLQMGSAGLRKSPRVPRLHSKGRRQAPKSLQSESGNFRVQFRSYVSAALIALILVVWALWAGTLLMLHFFG
jgi:hypothetical protein